MRRPNGGAKDERLVLERDMAVQNQTEAQLIERKVVGYGGKFLPVAGSQNFGYPVYAVMS